MVAFLEARVPFGAASSPAVRALVSFSIQAAAVFRLPSFMEMPIFDAA